MNVVAESVPSTKSKQANPVKKMLIICARGTLEDVYAALVMANGALMEGMKASMFFTFFGLDAIKKDSQDKLHTATVGNPAFMPKLPTMIGGLPGFEAMASSTMKKAMDKLDIPPVSEFLEIISASGGKIYACKLATDLFQLGKEDFIDDLEDIITVGDLYAIAGEEEGTHMVFI